MSRQPYNSSYPPPKQPNDNYNRPQQQMTYQNYHSPNRQAHQSHQQQTNYNQNYQQRSYQSMNQNQNYNNHNQQNQQLPPQYQQQGSTYGSYTQYNQHNMNNQQSRYDSYQHNSSNINNNNNLNNINNLNNMNNINNNNNDNKHPTYQSMNQINQMNQMNQQHSTYQSMNSMNQINQMNQNEQLPQHRPISYKADSDMRKSIVNTNGQVELKTNVIVVTDYIKPFSPSEDPFRSATVFESHLKTYNIKIISVNDRKTAESIMSKFKVNFTGRESKIAHWGMEYWMRHAIFDSEKGVCLIKIDHIPPNVIVHANGCYEYKNISKKYYE